MRRVLGASLASLLTAGIASAQSRDPAAAEALFRAARVAADRGDFTVACAKFEESNRLDPALGTLFNLADCDEHIGKTASAWQLFKEVAERLPHGDDRVAIAAGRARGLEQRLPRIVLKVRAPLPSGAKVLRDGVELSSASFDLALPVDPGTHQIVVKAPGSADREQIVTAAAGTTNELWLEAGGNQLAAGSSVPVERATREPTIETRGASRRTFGIALIGVGGAGLATSLVAGAIALSAKNTVDAECSAKVCSTAGLDAGDRGRTAATLSTVAIGVGLASAAVGTYLLLTAASDSAAPPRAVRMPLQASFVPGGAFVTIDGTFGGLLR